MVYNWIEFILNRLYPGNCLLCGSHPVEQPGFCNSCLQELPYNPHFCHNCALPLPPETPPLSRCGACRNTPPHFDQCLAPLRYIPPANRLVSQLKFNGKLPVRHALSQLMGDFIEHYQETLPELIIPVPLHPRRLARRGYNQALELARPLSRRFSIPLDIHSCIRARPTTPQTDLERGERRKNIRGAFAVTSPLTANHVALVDDVVTTGSTLSEFARTLKHQGVKRVDAWALARTP